MSILSWTNLHPFLVREEYVLPDFVCSGSILISKGAEHGKQVTSFEQGAQFDHMSIGPSGRVFELASVTKLLTTWAILTGITRGAYTLDTPIHTPHHQSEPTTLRHLFTHSSGLPFDAGQRPIQAQRKRIYSNLGIEYAAEFAAQRLGVSFAQWLETSVLQPLDMNSTNLHGSPAWGARSTVKDLTIFAQELLAPTLIEESLIQEFRTIHYPELSGIVPGYGSFSPSPWGLGCQIRGTNVHWLSAQQSEQTFGHFGQAGSFLWVDPQASVASVFLGQKPFGAWHKDNWVKLNAAIAQCFYGNGSNKLS